MTETIRAGDLTQEHVGRRFRFVSAPFGDPYHAVGVLTWLGHDDAGAVSMEVEDGESSHTLNLHPNNTLEAL